MLQTLSANYAKRFSYVYGTTSDVFGDSGRERLHCAIQRRLVSHTCSSLRLWISDIATEFKKIDCMHRHSGDRLQ